MVHGLGSVLLAGVFRNMCGCHVPAQPHSAGCPGKSGSALHLSLRSWCSGGRLHPCRYTTDSRRTVPLRRPRRCWIGVSGVPGSWGGDSEGHRTVSCSISSPSVFVFFYPEFSVAEITVMRTGRFPPAEDCSLGLLEAMSETGVLAGPDSCEGWRGESFLASFSL